MNQIFVHLFISFLINTVEMEIFTSIDDMSYLIDVEEAVIVRLESHIQMREKQLEFLKQQAHVFKKNHELAAANVSAYLSNPVNAYLITKRLTIDLEDLDRTDSFRLDDHIFTNLTDRNGVILVLPTIEDLKGAVDALTRLQDTYELDASNLADGVTTENAQKNDRLTANDCYQVGFYSLNGLNKHKYQFEHAISWFNLALDRLTDGTLGNDGKSKIRILGHLGYAFYMNENFIGALAVSEEILLIDPEDETAIQNRNTVIKHIELIKNQPAAPEAKEEQTTGKEWMLGYDPLQISVYQNLCRNKIVRSPKQLATLKCKYVTNNIPFLKIGPLKLEEESHDPYIVVYHDVIYDTEIEIIKNLARPMLIRSGVGSGKSEEIADYRVSKFAWLNDTELTAKRVSNRVQDMTGLSIIFSEMLQILNYGIGGHYAPHFDFSHDESDFADGNRIATVLFYLSDVTEGGATVFPFLNVTLWPQKGSAAFWYNLHKSGQGDLRTKHAGCPVLIGSKWIANKWLHTKDQEFKRLCDPQPDHL